MSRSRFLFVMWEGGGNVPPQLDVARRLVQRGHEVRVLGEPSIEHEVTATGASFASFRLAPHRHDRSRDSDFVRDFDARTPLGAFAAVRDNVLLGPAHAYALDTAAEIARFRPDVLSPDWMLLGAAVAGEAARVPTAALVHNINLAPEPGKAAPGFGFMPSDSWLGRIRDQAFVEMFLRLFNRGLKPLNHARAALGVPPLAHVLEQLGRPDRYLLLYSEAFDLPAARHPDNLRYVGPQLAAPEWTSAWTSPWALNSVAPLVLISMSTTYMAQERALRSCIKAAAGMPLKALVTVGPALDPSAFTAPANVQVVASAPHDQVLVGAAAVVTHAGLGTVTRALAHGVPLVCMPMGRDQDDVAARVVWHGAGLRVARNARPEVIRAALGRVLGDPAFKQAAAQLRAAIEVDLAADRAVAELEGLAAAAGTVGRRRPQAGPSQVEEED